MVNIGHVWQVVKKTTAPISPENSNDRYSPQLACFLQRLAELAARNGLHGLDRNRRMRVLRPRRIGPQRIVCMSRAAGKSTGLSGGKPPFLAAPSLDRPSAKP
jgi:hypothetical protein